MSRSYKKVPVIKDYESGRWGKRQANKAVRRIPCELFKGKEYKKVYSSWEIHDYSELYTKEEAIEDWNREEAYPEAHRWRHKKYGTLERWLIAWEKMMIRK